MNPGCIERNINDMTAPGNRGLPETPDAPTTYRKHGLLPDGRKPKEWHVTV
ncbi:hypothetical protein ACHAWO_013327 [Cyclotella atomus]|jgi:hypothetical protein|uniref:Uncharacterized protein n=1 Tax=Cyclotella atomus TaxID=382360 RepID=A0ABD3P694_9STRA